MKRITLLFSLFLLSVSSLKAQNRLTAEDIAKECQTAGGSWVSIHDPSVVLHNGTYTIWGSHLGVAQSKDLITWTPLRASSSTFVKLAKQGATSGTNCTFADAFNTQQVTKVTDCKGNVVNMPNFDAEAYCSRYASDKQTWVNGNMWAPDIVWNENMQKWCMYLSLNGDHWSSIIILLTSNSPTGPFTYQAPIVMGGFHSQTINGVPSATYGETDYNIVTGESSLNSRYNQAKNGTYWPNCIDPCTFFDEEGELWMTYGSWSGGIWMLKLDKNTGLRDYTVKYESDFASRGASGVSDPYFGKKIAGGYYVSGEGSYIQHIGDYYYLFMSYGGFAPDGGYEMRIFRSKNPDGPYADAAGNSALFTSYQLNYGPKAATNRGMLLMASYNDWGNLHQVGERAQGHNSACVDDKGRAFVVYHTKFNDGTAGHQVRTHQLFTNSKGWLVAAPFCYRGETTTDAEIATSCPWTNEELAGEYHVLMHPYKMDHANYEEMTPGLIKLSTDGKVTGDFTGTWSVKEGTAYLTLKLGTTTYEGVFCPQEINGSSKQGYKTSNMKAIAFTATSTSGVPVWGYKFDDKTSVAWNYQQIIANMSLKAGQYVNSHLSIASPTTENATLTWTSSAPEVISETGKYNPAGLTEVLPVTLTGRLQCGNYYWEQEYNVKAQKESIPSGDYLSGIVAYYNFDEKPTYNHYKPATATDYDRITYSKLGSGVAPTLETDLDRMGQCVRITQGTISNNSVARMPNPLLDVPMEGFTVSAWIKRSDANLQDAIWSFWNSTMASSSQPRLFLTGNAYIGYNDNASAWFDINKPTETGYTDIPVGVWTLVTISVGPSYGVRIYINGTNKTTHTVASSDGVTSARSLAYKDVVSTVQKQKYFCLGMGSFAGSADVLVDDLIIYNRELSTSDIRALNTMSNRVSDFAAGENGTGILAPWQSASHTAPLRGTFDLSGRRIQSLVTPGIYIQDGKKVVK